MGREVKRVPMDFEWTQGVVWFGYLLPPVLCRHCKGTGKRKTPQVDISDGFVSEWCPVCGGDKKVYPKVELPEGPGYQMWETTSEGSPISPVFATPEELAQWLADNGASTFGSMTTTYEAWLKMIKGSGWAPSAVMIGGVLKSGVDGL